MILKKALWLFGIAVLLLILFLPGYARLNQLKDKNRDLETSIRKLKIENSLLNQELKRVENDPLYQEKIARDKMGIVRKGEIPVKIIPEKQ
ncbi:MAG: septum formation initiator family protein [Candidatus Omnitrophota bacterium]